MHSSSLRRVLAVALAAMFTAVACGTGSSTNKGTIHFLGVWAGAEQASWFAVLKPFEDSTGIKISYEASRDQDAILTSTVAAGNPPDVAGAPSPQLLSQFAKQGKLIALNSAVDMTALQPNTPPRWFKLGDPRNSRRRYQVFPYGALTALISYA